MVSSFRVTKHYCGAKCKLPRKSPGSTPMKLFSHKAIFGWLPVKPVGLLDVENLDEVGEPHLGVGLGQPNQRLQLTRVSCDLKKSQVFIRLTQIKDRKPTINSKTN